MEKSGPTSLDPSVASRQRLAIYRPPRGGSLSASSINNLLSRDQLCRSIFFFLFRVLGSKVFICKYFLKINMIDDYWTRIILLLGLIFGFSSRKGEIDKHITIKKK